MEYNIKEVLGVLLMYIDMCTGAFELMEPFKNELLDNYKALYGPLSECVQVKGKIALEYIRMNGIHVDTHDLYALKSKMKDLLKTSVEKLTKNPRYSPIFNFTIENGKVPSF